MVSVVYSYHMIERFTYFWGGHHPFSQWFIDAPFEINGLRYQTAENWMMWQKARLFGAKPELCETIRLAHPRDARRLGREVECFSSAIWSVASLPIVVQGNIAKFAQHPALLCQLLATAGTTLVEASPTDQVWGIGLAADDPRARQRASWRGRNQLGQVLTHVRDILLLARAS